MATTVQNPFDTQPANATNQTPAAQNTSTPGLISSNLPQPNQVTSYTPETRQINQTTDTVQGQVNSILSKDSPLMQRARTLATQQMAQRGLVNSSMAAGAGTAAMIDRATPIATQDANIYNTVASENTGAKNRAFEFSAGATNQFGLQRGEQQFQNEQLQKQQQFTTSERMGTQSFTNEMETARQGFTASQAALDRAQQAYLQDRSAENQMTLQKAQQDFTASQASMDRMQQAYMLQMQQSFTSEQAGLDRMQQAYLQDDAQAFQQALANSQIPTSFALQISTSTMESVKAIAADPNLSGKPDKDGTSPKSRAIQSAINYANAQISWANKFYNTIIPELPTS